MRMGKSRLNEERMQAGIVLFLESEDLAHFPLKVNQIKFLPLFQIGKV